MERQKYVPDLCNVSIITLTSDFGEGSHYTAALKGALLSRAPEAQIVDVSHRVRKFDVIEAAFILRSVYPEFPKGTVHLICVQGANTPETPHRLVTMQGQHFIGADTGVFRLLANTEPEAVFDFSGLNLDVDSPTFPEREVFALAAAHLAKGGRADLIGRPAGSLRNAEPRRMSFEENTIIGHVVFIDDYGNVVTNITKESFNKIGKNRPFEIQMRTPRMTIRSMSEHYHDVPTGKELALFNHNGVLEIAVNNHSAPGGHGGADALLGLRRDQAIRINFQSETSL
ncbi:SAM-dependent chlorinase/fluorinase [Flavobacteriales bacterium]|jgi:S-adenosylmethionine hydrolase|nr:SAM-dependent chlorinase/fluorinase [Flavobacteriales bacterium]